MLEIASLKIDNESHYLLIIPKVLANVKKIAINSWIIARIGLIIPAIFVNVKKICKKCQISENLISISVAEVPTEVLCHLHFHWRESSHPSKTPTMKH